MADVDEDRPVVGPEAADEELDEEVVDYRFIAALTGDGGKIPKRGEKDFEPHQTALQASALESSREAMHAAISHPRVHFPKNHLVGVYEPDTGLTDIPRPSDIYFRTLGRVIRGRERLFPEEALYLLERGALDVRWPAEDGEDAGAVETTKEMIVDGKKMKTVVRTPYGLAMSLQAAYAVYLGMEHGGLSLDRYLVYANLKRSGYIVQRAETWDRIQTDLVDANALQSVESDTHHWWTLLWNRLLSGFEDQAKLKAGPLSTPGLYRSYADIYHVLQLIPFHNPKATPPTANLVDEQSPYRVAFNVYKPGGNFKKSSPGPPDFRIAVISARDDKSIPTLPELDALWSQTPFSPPDEKKSLNMRLLHGYRNVILAVVDCGIISYLRLADAAFGLERIYERAPARGDKSGRRGRGRGGRGGSSGRGRRGRG